MTGETQDIDWTKIYGGKVTENVVQAMARIVVSEQMNQVGQRYHVAFQVHDEIIITAPENDATHAEKFIVGCMSTPPAWAPELPVACEAGTAKNYGDT
jgi:DNA polymerase